MGKLVWKIMRTGATALSDVVSKKLVTAAWKVAAGKRPPGPMSDPRVSLPGAIGWAAASGAIVGVARLLATRKAAAYYTKSAGHPPEALEEGQLAVGSF